MVTFKMKTLDIACSPRKMQLVCHLIRRRNLDDALVILEHTPKKAAHFLSKSLKNAQSVAADQHNLQQSTLSIESIFITSGRTLKRYRLLYRGRGRRYVQIQKKRSHLFLTVGGLPRKAVKTAKSSSRADNAKSKKAKRS